MFAIAEDKNDKYTINNIMIEDFVNKKFCVFDLEGTGLDCERDSIIQFGAVIVEDKGMIHPERFDRLVKPSMPIPAKIENLTGITNEMVKDAGSFKDVFQEFQQFSQGCIMVAQCGYEYDFRILRSECQRRGLPIGDSVEMDTKILFKFLHPELLDTFSTDFLLNYYSIDASGLKRHTALDDSILVAHIMVHMLRELRDKRISDLIISTPVEIKKFIPRALS
ncbi:MAG: polymerase epsilon subunit-like 3-5 exonuclease [Paenibacillaceae bacterium]|jgi:DNA polymerase III alpha subunit (gram-positive type)|nr:polymerase epsilon subunit-like 3-5 exonuclease [Paenibacillaceae bacterium]